MVGMSWSSSSCVQGVPSALMRCKDELGRKEWMSSGSWRLCLPIQCRLYTAAAVCTVHSLSAETAPRVNATAENASLPELCMSETSNLFKCLGLKKRFSFAEMTDDSSADFSAELGSTFDPDFDPSKEQMSDFGTHAFTVSVYSPPPPGE